MGKVDKSLRFGELIKGIIGFLKRRMIKRGIKR
jgi:hypothetical protein